MSPSHPRRRSAAGTRGQILQLLRRGSATVDELASALRLTSNAVRAHIVALERDGLIQRTGMRPSASKPAVTYGVTPGAELLFSRAYAPVLQQLLQVLAERTSRSEFDQLMREVGRALMAGRTPPRGALRTRVLAGSELLNELGGVTEVERWDGGWLIRGHGCPLSAVTYTHPEACRAVESLLREFVGGYVESCCHRGEELRCCFEVPAHAQQRGEISTRASTRRRS